MSRAYEAEVRHYNPTGPGGPQEASQGRDHLFGGAIGTKPSLSAQENERDRRLRLRAEERQRRHAGNTTSAYAQAEAAQDHLNRWEEPKYAPSPNLPSYPQTYQQVDYSLADQRAYAPEPQLPYAQPYSQPAQSRFDAQSRPSYGGEPSAAYRPPQDSRVQEPETYHPRREQPISRPSLGEIEAPATESKSVEYTGLMLGGDSDKRKLEQKRRLQEDYAEYLRSQQPKSKPPETPTGGAFVLVDRDDKAEKQRRYREQLDMQLQSRPTDSKGEAPRPTSHSREPDGPQSGELDRRRIEYEMKLKYAEELKAQMQSKQQQRQPEVVEYFENISKPTKPKIEHQEQYRQQLQQQIEEKKRRADEERKRRAEEDMRVEQKLKQDTGNSENKPIVKVVTKDPNRPSDDHPNADRYKQLMNQKQVSEPTDGIKGRLIDQYSDEPSYGKAMDLGPKGRPFDNATHGGLTDQLPSRPQVGYPPTREMSGPPPQLHNYPPPPSHNYPPAPNYPPMGQGYMQAQYGDNYALNKELQEMQRERERSKEQILELKAMMLQERERALYEMAQAMQSRTPSYPQYPSPYMQHPLHVAQYPPHSGYPPPPLSGFAPHPGYPPQTYFSAMPTHPTFQPSEPYLPSSVPLQPPYPPSAQQFNADNIMSFSHKLDIYENPSSSSDIDKLPPPQYRQDIQPNSKPQAKRTVSATFNPTIDQFEQARGGNPELLKSIEIVSAYHMNALNSEEPEHSQRLRLERSGDLFEQSLACDSKWVDESNMKWGSTKLLDSVADLNSVKSSQANPQRKGWKQSTDPFKTPQPIEKQIVDATPRFNMHQLLSPQDLEESLPSNIVYMPMAQSQEAPLAEEIIEESFEEEQPYMASPASIADESCTVQVGLMSDENIAAEMGFADEIAKNFEDATDSEEENQEIKAANSQFKVRPASMSSRTKPKTLDVFKPKFRESPRKLPLEPQQPAIVEQSVEQSGSLPFHNLKDARAKHKAGKKSSAFDNIDSILERLQGSPEKPPTTASKFTRNAIEELRSEK